MDWNPLNSSAFTGAGTPWGAKNSSGPDYSGFNMDPESYKGFDSSKLRQALSRRIAQRGGQAQAQAQAALTKSGIKGADTTRALTDLAGQQELNTNEMDANLALQDYQSKMQQMAIARDQYNMGQNWAGAQSQSEDASRSALWNSLFNVGASVGGAVAGSWADKKFGGQTPGTPGVAGADVSSSAPWKLPKGVQLYGRV